MNELLARAGALFLAPEASAIRPAVAPRNPRLAAVLAAPADLIPAAGGAAAALKVAGRSSAAVLCRPGDPFPARPATPAATALARRLASRDVAATPAGTLCRVALAEGDAPCAVGEFWRLTAAVDVPTVLALPGRLDGFDDLLAEMDQLYLAAPEDADEALTTLAVASLQRLGPPVIRLRPASTAVARRSAAIGVGGRDLAVRPQAVSA